MGHSGFFSLDAAGQEWTGFRTLAILCSRARVTNIQAQVLLLWCRGLSYVEIANTLSLSSRSIARKYYLGGTRHIAEVLDPYCQLKDEFDPETGARKRRDPLKLSLHLPLTSKQAAAILEAFRNREVGKGGGHVPLIPDRHNCTWQPKGSPSLVTVDDLTGRRVPYMHEVDCSEDRLTFEEELILWLARLAWDGPSPTYDRERNMRTTV